jgi:exodeoxyribonuclease V beta subunit
MTALDLNRHGVVVASAGTGKTYTLERLVLRLICEEHAKFEQILLVTYTEKAAGELKRRLRETLEERAGRDAEHRQALQAAIDSFDKAAISTIHGFCQRVLQDHAFENRHEFRADLVQDPDLLDSCLREIQRTCWRSDFGEHLARVLELAGYDQPGRKAEDWEKKVQELALRYRPRCDHRLRPELPADWLERLRKQLAAGPEEPALGEQLLVHSVLQLQDRLAQVKRERGQQSFEDMILRVDEALDEKLNPGAASLVASLRRYRYAVVDEFQDTDPIQWRIFRRIFVEGGGDHRLFVVGDPKQAIFGFRGADLHTFLVAQNDLVRRYGAVQQDLTTNWRSSPELLESLNQLFAKGGWFEPTGLPYTPVEPAPAQERKNEVLEDRSGRAALTLIDLSNYDYITPARRHYAKVIAGEIRRLLGGVGGKPALEFTVKGEKRALQAGDISVLVWRRREALPVIEAFREAGIPFTFYKQQGLWQSPEAVQLGYILRALARPEEPALFRKSLLTRFYGIRPEDLAQAEALPFEHAINDFFMTCRELAEERRWAELFQTLLEKTGVLFTDSGATGAERSLANFRHIMQTLEQAAYGNNLDLFGLLERFNQLRLRTGDEDTAVQPIETDRPKVRILTIHTSKGLEAPVVFLAGGFTHGLASSWCTYRDDHGNIVFDVAADEQAKQRADKERDDEDRRVFYVALTRAMFKLYVPQVAYDKTSYRMPGPVVNILTQAIEKSGLERMHPSLVARVAKSEQNRLAALRLQPAAPSPQMVQAPALVAADLFPRLDPDLAQRRIVTKSFSSLHRQRVLAPDEPEEADWSPRTDDDAPDPLDGDGLLRGPVFGALVHEVIENMDFAAIAAASGPPVLLNAGTASRLLIDEQIARHLPELIVEESNAPVAQHCRETVAALVWQALRTPLAALGGRLADVPAQDRLHELEFAFPEALEPPPPEVRRQEGFWVGVIDLVVRRGNRFFLFDWKTNLLQGAYTPAELTRNMKECEYDRQYRLYLHALGRWLSRVRGKAFDFERDFGGVYYLYLRGMNGRDETAGVFLARPSTDDLCLERILAR